MILSIVRLLAAVILAFLAGKLISKLKLPSILGWLIAGMALGPHALSLVNSALLDAVWYQSAVHILECAVGLMIGTELVWKRIKKSGRSIIITTLTQSLGTFLLVSLVFGIVFYFTNIPLYLAFLFGGIALATAPAPALSIVREFKTKGPVTSTLIPMAALDDIVGCILFFTTIALVAGNLSAGEMPAYMIALVVLLPLAIGVVTGLLAGLVLKKERPAPVTLFLLIFTILIASGVGFLCNGLLPRPVLNFMLIGMAFSATFSNMMPEERLEQIMKGFNSRRGHDCRHPQSRRAAGLPSDPGGRAVYRHLHHCPGIGEIFWSVLRRGGHQVAQNRAEFSGLHLTAPFGGVPGLYRYRRVCADRPGSRMRENHPGYHRRRGGYQRDHRGYHGEKRIRMGGGISQRRA